MLAARKRAGTKVTSKGKKANQDFYVHCDNCTANDSTCKFPHATIEREDDHTIIPIRMGKRQSVCSICFDKFIDRKRSFCFLCSSKVQLKTVIICKECKRPAVELPGVHSVENDEDFDCPLQIADCCEESGLAIW